MSIMKRLNDNGGIAAVVTISLLAAFFTAALGFAVWAYQGRQDYKNNSDQKVAAAVVTAKDQQKKEDAKAITDAKNNPFDMYQGPEQYGSLVVKYPRSWSAYVDATGKSSAVIDGYFEPGTVPSLNDTGSVFALRLQVLSQSYSDVVSGISSQQNGATTKAKVAPYSLPKVPSIVGIRVDGPLTQNKTGSMIVLPLRDKTIEIWTESTQFQPDFNTNILPNISFSP